MPNLNRFPDETDFRIALAERRARTKAPENSDPLKAIMERWDRSLAAAKRTVDARRRAARRDANRLTSNSLRDLLTRDHDGRR